MFFETEAQCTVCNMAYVVYPAYATVAKIRQRTLPAWKRCWCGFEEISTSEFDTLVPAWEKLIAPGDPNELLEE